MLYCLHDSFNIHVVIIYILFDFQVGSALARKARLMHDYMVETRSNKSIREIKEFVSKLPQMLANKQSLATHTTIAEYIKEVMFKIHNILINEILVTN